MKRVLVVASGGGHWTQMLRLRDALIDYDVAYVGVKSMYYSDVAPCRFYAVPDVSRLHRWKIIPALLQLSAILLKERPAVIITTGSAPGMLALRLGKFLGAKTVWIDSIANVDQMSMSGTKARPYADLWLTQWPHLAKDGGPAYFGSVL
jgi:UDP-N-acetylglucosamine:LPS N-acetylglucosamine transferase